MRDAFLPYALPSLGEEEIAEVVDTLRSGWLTTGPKTQRFEREFAEFVGVKHAIAVNSATAGLRASLAAIDVGPEHEVIVPSMTFCATANVVVHAGARPVLVDCGEDFNIDPEAVARAITPRTRAIIPVHFGGQPANMDELIAIADRAGVDLLEDAAHAIGVNYRGRPVGTIGKTASFSFYATKNLTTGEGGMITTNDDAVAERLRRLVLHGMSRDAWARYTATGSWYYEVVEAGFKMNMTDVQSSIGLHQLARVNGFNARRAEIAARYDRAFRSLPLVLPIRHDDRVHNWHLYVVQLEPDRLELDRGEFIKALAARNIGTSVHFIPVHMHPYYRDRFGYAEEDLPLTARLYRNAVSLPLYPKMSDRDVRDVIEAVIETCGARRTDDA
jgi:dTDP-4-amino-4,6-dideoxygalactose transaminase